MSDIRLRRICAISVLLLSIPALAANRRGFADGRVVKLPSRIDDVAIADANATIFGFCLARNSIYVVSGESGDIKTELKFSDMLRSPLECSRDGATLFLCMREHPTMLLQLVRSIDRSVLQQRKLSVDHVLNLQRSATGDHLLCVGRRKSVSESAVIDVMISDTLQSVATYNAKKETIYSGSFLSDHEVVLCDSMGIAIWDFVKDDLTRPFGGEDVLTSRSVVAKQDENRIGYYGIAGATVIEPDSGVRHIFPRWIPGDEQLQGSRLLVADAVFIPRSSLLAIAYVERDVAIWDVKRFRRTHLYSTTDLNTSLVASDDGKMLVSSGGDFEGEIRIWMISEPK